MGYGDNRYGGDHRGGERRHGDASGRWDRERSSYGSWGGERDRDRGDWGRGREEDDRGFIERAGERVRSWFSDDDDDRSRRYERGEERGGRESFGGGWGNQRGWTDDRFDRDYGSRERGGGGGSGRYVERGSGYGGGGEGGGADVWGGSGYGGANDTGRRFDRIDAGSVGTQGVHPMSSPLGGVYGGGFGAAGGSSARERAIMEEARHQQGGGGSGRIAGSYGGGGSYGHEQGYGGHDPHYSEWRQRQIEQLDRDYQDYCRENQSRFEQEFGGWREKRQSQRQMIGRVTEHMTVVGSDGQPIGTVDKVRGDRIILTRSDPSSGGAHHSIPCSWVERVEDQVTVNKTADEAMRHWQEEDRNRALFERPGQGSEGPHVLNQSFAGTYDDKTDR